MTYNFDRKFKFGKFNVQVDTAACYGWFEHEELGDECGGGLWFERHDLVLDLVDYDGTFELPKAVIDGLRSEGFTVEEIFE